MEKIGDNVFLLVLISMGGVCLLIVLFVLVFARYQGRLLRQQERLHAERMKHQQELLEVLIQSQEEERRRIGRDLHDEVGNALSNLRLTVDVFSARVPTADAMVAFTRDCKQTIDRVIKDVRAISHDLSPVTLELLGLEEAIAEQAETISRSGKIKAHFENQAGQCVNRLSDNQALACYRVLCELLTNTVRHAGASEINILFSDDGNHFSIRYHDNGKGLLQNNSSKGMGMQNIESRLSAIHAIFELSAVNAGYFSMEIKLPHALLTGKI
ncbi:hypothetical protein KTO58_09515 [Chitinophaga pendula]|uniref:sensor histidine kinase n=1 Tax=Chitinophaga TaxID=79328 RepID=UPI000BAF11CB|nr:MULTISPECIES: histidine kinase [Chitinophaga]ASZ12966.1 hypothetical protein CK934_19385 [Chitinophaga sp. MD30]UCJ09401.1 hypothetical protein KTO58_09515 [Chitinophaga pendula]